MFESRHGSHLGIGCLCGHAMRKTDSCEPTNEGLLLKRKTSIQSEIFSSHTCGDRDRNLKRRYFLQYYILRYETEYQTSVMVASRQLHTINSHSIMKQVIRLRLQFPSVLKYISVTENLACADTTSPVCRWIIMSVCSCSSAACLSLPFAVVENQATGLFSYFTSLLLGVAFHLIGTR